MNIVLCASYVLVMLCGMMFGAVVSVIRASFLPACIYLLLYLLVSEPVETYVPGFGSFLINVVLDEAARGRVVGFEWCRSLRMMKAFENMSNWDRCLCIIEHSCSFGFGSKRKDILKALAFNEHRTI